MTIRESAKINNHDRIRTIILSNYRSFVAVSLALALSVSACLAQAPGKGKPQMPRTPSMPAPGQKLRAVQPNLKLLPDKPKLGGSTATLNFQTNLGSFRSANGAGKIQFSFSGTVLIHNWDLDVKNKDIEKAPKTYKVTLQGNIRKEYEKHGRAVYFGKGTITIEGVWRAIQWFGKNMKGQWTGAGSISIVGEFDKQGDTGLYWYDPAKKNYWPTSLIELTLPERVFDQQAEPTERKKG